jgi:hypothetical protein
MPPSIIMIDRLTLQLIHGRRSRSGMKIVYNGSGMGAPLRHNESD